MRHEQASLLLPDLLTDRDQPELLVHVAACHSCQRRLFLLGRVDRLLRELAVERRKRRRRPRWSRWLRLSSMLAAALGIVSFCVLVLILPRPTAPGAFTLHAVSGSPVGHARLTAADDQNLSLLLTTNGLPVPPRGGYLLWASNSRREAIPVGRFMVSTSGSCRVNFDLPAGQRWTRLWVTPPDQPSTLIATT